ncbi:hypothetical protein SAMN05216312_101761 [Cohnella sp. OV330]|uniref:hypothetical protein n=1 Tax=Cohnella sp. OV330 TaxID=1855288 RepID=UPI0008F25766|nr:hypothetical protein [Cohnella sp. OV330]SFA83179.1 hypothetical protein SAMN05216312_101761 [Cohnella sp. OV330]
MAMAMYKIRIIANACITRYDDGERELPDIVNSYNLSTDDATLVKAEIATNRPDITI